MHCSVSHSYAVGIFRSQAAVANVAYCRGPIDTPMINKVASVTPSIDGIKLAINRKGRPEEVAKLIAFLLSDESTYTTGSCYTIDGGYMA